MSAGLVACAEPPSESGIALNQPLTAMAASAPTSGRVTFMAAGGTVMQPQALDFTIGSVEVLAHSDGGKVELDDWRLGLGDMTVAPSALPPSGLQLKNVTVQLQKQASAAPESMTPSALAAELPVEVALRADLVVGENKTYPLGPVAVAPLAMSLSMARDGAATMLNISAHCDGGCWDVPGVAHFSDGKIDLALPVTVASY